MAALIVNTTAQLNTSGSDSPAYAGVVLNQGFFSSSMGSHGNFANGASVVIAFLYTGVAHVIAYAPGISGSPTCGFSHALVFDNGNGTSGGSGSSSISLSTAGGLSISAVNDGIGANVSMTNTSNSNRDIYSNIMLLSQ